jgi:hypothetical protein
LPFEILNFEPLEIRRNDIQTKLARPKVETPVDLGVDTRSAIGGEVQCRLHDLFDTARILITRNESAVIVVDRIAWVGCAVRVEAAVQCDRRGDDADRLLDADVVVVERGGQA